MPARLQDRTALVTGSTDGIGAAIAHALAAEGARVVVTGRDHPRGNAVVGSIGAAGGRAAFIRSDLGGGIDGIRALVDAGTSAAGGPFDLLVNNAAMLVMPSPTSEVTTGVIDAVLTVNVRAAIVLTGLIAPGMADRQRGAIVNVGSINGLVGMDGSALYSASKAALHSLTKSWAAEFGPSGVRVNTVAPGPTLTDRTVAIQEHIAPLLATVPSRRASTTAEVAQAVVFLASDDASNVHGATLSVDGGFTAV
jgi:NAD(P)-dependent dehydrogenase (short-subunit alcohol dehydrogenase family)